MQKYIFAKIFVANLISSKPSAWVKLREVQLTAAAADIFVSRPIILDSCSSGK